MAKMKEKMMGQREMDSMTPSLQVYNSMSNFVLRWPRRVIHCALRQMRNGTPQWNTAMELTVNGRSQWKPAAMLGVGIEQRHLR